MTSSGEINFFIAPLMCDKVGGIHPVVNLTLVESKRTVLRDRTRMALCIVGNDTHTLRPLLCLHAVVLFSKSFTVLLDFVRPLQST